MYGNIKVTYTRPDHRMGTNILRHTMTTHIILFRNRKKILRAMFSSKSDSTTERRKWKGLGNFNLRPNAVWQFEQVNRYLMMVKYARNMQRSLILIVLLF